MACWNIPTRETLGVLVSFAAVTNDPPVAVAYSTGSSLTHVTCQLWGDCSSAWAVTLLLIQGLKWSLSVGHAILVAEGKVKSVGGNLP